MQQICKCGAVREAQRCKACRTYQQYKSNANFSGREFALTRLQFETLRCQPCAYCGGRGFGLDRIDSGRGYTVENCAPCCSWCNIMKRHYSLDEFKNHIRAIAIHLQLLGGS